MFRGGNSIETKSEDEDQKLTGMGLSGKNVLELESRIIVQHSECTKNRTAQFKWWF